MYQIRIALFVLLACLDSAHAVVVVPPGPLSAARDPQEAQSAYDKASRLAQRHQFAAAMEHARRSLTLDPTAQRAALVGAIAVELARPLEAFEALVLAVSLDRERKLEDYIAKRLAGLPPLAPTDLGIVRFQLEPPAASCTLDTTAEPFELGPARLAVGLPAGRQAVTCGAPGFEEAQLELEVPARGVVTASLRLQPRVEVRDEPAPRIEDGSDATLPLALLIGGGVLVASGVGLHVWALDAKSAGDDALARAPQDYDTARADYARASDDLALRRGLALGAYALGAVLIGTGAVLLLVDDDAPTVTLVPTLGSDHAGAICGFHF